MSRKSYHILAIVTLTGLITYLHFVTKRQFSALVVFEELYYLPLLVPLTLLKHYVRKYDRQYLQGQVYLSPHAGSKIFSALLPELLSILS